MKINFEFNDTIGPDNLIDNRDFWKNLSTGRMNIMEILKDKKSAKALIRAVILVSGFETQLKYSRLAVHSYFNEQEVES